MGFSSDVSARFDRFQASSPLLAFPVAVVRKYVDDQGGALASLITFYGFLSVFPLILLFVTIVGIVVGSDPHLQERIISSALDEFPVVGAHLRTSIHALNRADPAVFVVTVVILAWGSLGITRSMQRASQHVWDVPRTARATWRVRIARGLLLLAVMGAAVVLSSILAGFSIIGTGEPGYHHAVNGLVTLGGAAVVNVAAYLVALHLLAPEGTPWRALLWGTALGGVGWTVLQAAGGYLIEHQLRHATELYGFFGIVLGIVLWLTIGSHLFLVASEVNIVRLRRLWPRRLHEGEPLAPDPAPGPHPAAESGA